MAQKTTVSASTNVLRSDEIPENFNVGRFLFTKKTITYDGKTVQLSNVTKISKYGYRETYNPVFAISEDLMKKAGIALLLSAIGAYFFSEISFLSTIAILVLLGAIAIIAYGFYERSQRKPFDKNFYGLIIETSSGKAENLLTQNREFIETLFHEITRAMNDVDFKTIVANFSDHKITYVDNKHIETVLGDKYQDITDSTILNRSANGNDVDLEKLIREM